jgi:dTMP kinase
MGHQGGKIPDKAKRLEYFKWNAHLEYEILGIPRPDLNIVLHMPSQIAQQLVDRKGSREYLKNGKTRDIHENDIEFLKRSEQTYAEMCELLPRQFTKISSMENDQLLPIGEISKKVIKLVENLITREQGAGV